MFALLRAFSTMFQSNENTFLTAAGSRSGSGFNEAAGPDDIAQLSARLCLASQLLIAPTPGSVYQVGLVLEEVQGRMAKLTRPAAEHDPNRIRGLQEELRRVRTLVEGALRVQWTQMRAVMALTQSYSPGGRISHWQPRVPKVDLKV